MVKKFKKQYKDKKDQSKHKKQTNKEIKKNIEKKPKKFGQYKKPVVEDRQIKRFRKVVQAKYGLKITIRTNPSK